MLQVVVHEKGGSTQRFNFEGDQFTVGREEDNDLVLDRVNISKHHLRLRRHDGRVEVLDLESTNGTYVNGRRVAAPRGVRRADRIYVGDFILMLEGDDPAIVPAEQTTVEVMGPDGEPRRRTITVPPPTANRERPLGAPTEVLGDDTGVMTSARRVAAPGVESTYLDTLVDRGLQTVLANISGLDPLRAEEVSDADREEALVLIDGLLQQMQQDGDIEAGVPLEELRGRIARELLDLGPLAELMKDDAVREIQVAGNGPIRVIRERVDGSTMPELTERRFSGDRALVLTIQRLARRWGFLVEGAQILEGKVDDGLAMYAILPPTQVRTPVLALRRSKTDATSLSALVQEGVLNMDMRELLVGAIKGSRRILVCASGGTNLDRFMGALIGEVPESLRVVCISDTGRLGNNPGWVQVRRITDPGDSVGLSDALGVLLRGGVDLLISQRCRHEDAAAVMDALAGATQGALVSMWGIDAAHALWRLAGLSTVAAGAIQDLTVSLARSVDLVVRLGMGVTGEAMQVLEIIEPRAKDGNEILHVPLFRAVKGADGSKEFKPTGTIPSFLRELADVGISLPLRLFKTATP